jgi:uncharacterized Zn finger protein (UPF0148 family)
MAMQAKCDKCKIRYKFTKDRKIGTVNCPDCGNVLKQTNMQSKFKVVVIDTATIR